MFKRLDVTQITDILYLENIQLASSQNIKRLNSTWVTNLKDYKVFVPVTQPDLSQNNKLFRTWKSNLNMTNLCYDQVNLTQLICIVRQIVHWLTHELHCSVAMCCNDYTQWLESWDSWLESRFFSMCLKDLTRLESMRLKDFTRVTDFFQSGKYLTQVKTSQDNSTRVTIFVD